MKRFVILACAFALTVALLGLYANRAKNPVPEVISFDYSKAAELARAECLPEGARLKSEEASVSDDYVTMILKFEKDEHVYKAEVVYKITQAYELTDKRLSPLE